MKFSMALSVVRRLQGWCAWPLVICIALSACTTDPANHKLLQDEVTQQVKDGMPLADAVTAMKSRGFSCMKGTSLQPGATGIFECNRSRAPLWPPYGCIHRIWFEAAPPNGAISKLQVFNPTCAGL
jgi:hypothetical protein